MYCLTTAPFPTVAGETSAGTFQSDIHLSYNRKVQGLGLHRAPARFYTDSTS